MRSTFWLFVTLATIAVAANFDNAQAASQVDCQALPLRI